MPFLNTQIPDLTSFIPGENFDPNKDRLVLITSAREQVLVQYATDRDRWTGVREHGEKHYWLDDRSIPRSIQSIWVRNLKPNLRGNWGGVFVTIDPDTGKIEFNAAKWMFSARLESVHPLESIIQTRRATRSWIEVADISTSTRRAALSDTAVVDAAGAELEQRMLHESGH